MTIKKPTLTLNTSIITDNVPQEVIPKVFIGSIHASLDTNELNKAGITHILNCSRFPSAFPNDFTYLAIDLRDKVEGNMLSCIPISNIFIEAGIDAGGVLVHCVGGRSRSAALIAAYIMSSTGADYDQSLALIKSVRSVVKVNDGFEMQLRAYSMNSFNVYTSQQILLRRRVGSLHHLLGSQVVVDSIKASNKLACAKLTQYYKNSSSSESPLTVDNEISSSDSSDSSNLYSMNIDYVKANSTQSNTNSEAISPKSTNNADIGIGIYINVETGSKRHWIDGDTKSTESKSGLSPNGRIDSVNPVFQIPELAVSQDSHSSPSPHLISIASMSISVSPSTVPAIVSREDSHSKLFPTIINKEFNNVVELDRLFSSKQTLRDESHLSFGNSMSSPLTKNPAESSSDRKRPLSLPKGFVSEKVKNHDMNTLNSDIFRISSKDSNNLEISSPVSVGSGNRSQFIPKGVVVESLLSQYLDDVGSANDSVNKINVSTKDLAIVEAGLTSSGSSTRKNSLHYQEYDTSNDSAGGLPRKSYTSAGVVLESDKSKSVSDMHKYNEFSASESNNMIINNQSDSFSKINDSSPAIVLPRILSRHSSFGEGSVSNNSLKYASTPNMYGNLLTNVASNVSSMYPSGSSTPTPNSSRNTIPVKPPTQYPMPQISEGRQGTSNIRLQHIKSPSELSSENTVSTNVPFSDSSLSTGGISPFIRKLSIDNGELFGETSNSRKLQSNMICTSSDDRSVRLDPLISRVSDKRLHRLDSKVTATPRDAFYNISRSPSDLTNSSFAPNTNESQVQLRNTQSNSRLREKYFDDNLITIDTSFNNDLMDRESSMITPDKSPQGLVNSPKSHFMDITAFEEFNVSASQDSKAIVHDVDDNLVESLNTLNGIDPDVTRNLTYSVKNAMRNDGTNDYDMINEMNADNGQESYSVNNDVDESKSRKKSSGQGYQSIIRQYIPLFDSKTPHIRFSRPGMNSIRVIPPLRGLDRSFKCAWCGIVLFSLANVIRVDDDMIEALKKPNCFDILPVRPRDVSADDRSHNFNQSDVDSTKVTPIFPNGLVHMPTSATNASTGAGIFDGSSSMDTSLQSPISPYFKGLRYFTEKKGQAILSENSVNEYHKSGSKDTITSETTMSESDHIADVTNGTTPDEHSGYMDTFDSNEYVNGFKIPSSTRNRNKTSKNKNKSHYFCDFEVESTELNSNSAFSFSSRQTEPTSHQNGTKNIFNDNSQYKSEYPTTGPVTNSIVPLYFTTSVRSPIQNVDPLNSHANNIKNNGNSTIFEMNSNKIKSQRSPFDFSFEQGQPELAINIKFSSPANSLSSSADVATNISSRVDETLIDTFKSISTPKSKVIPIDIRHVHETAYMNNVNNSNYVNTYNDDNSEQFIGCTEDSPRITLPPQHQPQPKLIRTQSVEKRRWLERVNLLREGAGDTKLSAIADADDEAEKLALGHDKYIFLEYLEWMGADCFCAEAKIGEISCFNCSRVIGSYTWSPTDKQSLNGKLGSPIFRVHRECVQSSAFPLDTTPLNRTYREVDD